jgi:hypothetical protein
MNKFVIILLDLSHLTHDSLLYIYIYIYIYIYHRIKVGCMSRAFANIKGLDAFFDFMGNDMLDNVRGNI